MKSTDLFSMFRFLIVTLCAISCLSSCKNQIKNSEVVIQEEPGTEVVESPQPENNKEEEITEKAHSDLLGFWVGYFENAADQIEKNLYIDDGFTWARENKINISIDRIIGDSVIGHSVVAGNDRPFHGKMTKEDIGFSFVVREPGDHRYDGEFQFRIASNGLVGTWIAYKNIDIRNRKYTLQKKDFSYDPNIMLEPTKAYLDWNNYKEEKQVIELEDNIMEEWVSKEFATATDLIYEINASNQLLTKEVIENLKKGDLTIIRNTIYARHGYSYKHRPLRIFFDAQPWYIPVFTDIKADFTDIEKQNIQLMLKYEKNAAEYYDYFGRG